MSGSSQNDNSWEDICHVAHSHRSRFRLNSMYRLPFDIQSVELDSTLYTEFEKLCNLWEYSELMNVTL
jgi:hypothetical protein